MTTRTESLGNDYEVKTARLLKDNYLKELQQRRKADQNFMEIEHLQQERNRVIELIKNIDPADPKADCLKKNLMNYLGAFLNGRIEVAEIEFKNHPQNFDKSVSDQADKDFKAIVEWFEGQMSAIVSSDLKETFIEEQIEKTEATTRKWLNEVDTMGENYTLKAHFIAGQRYYILLKTKLQEIRDSPERVYLWKDGKRVMSDYDFCKAAGLPTGNPTHNFTLLKDHRLKIFHSDKENFIQERKIDKVETTEFDVNAFRFAWLKRELKVIDGWLSHTDHTGKAKLIKPSTSKQIEILKYKQFVEENIQNIKQKLTSTKKTESNSKEVASNTESLLNEISNSENKFWKGLPMETVVKHFIVMTEKKSKNGRPYLSLEQLVSFLKKAFLQDATQPKQRINCGRGEKGFVIKRFYELFDLAVSQYYYPQQKGPFIEMFIDCFDNWQAHTIKSFFRPNKAMQQW